jgi:hypothetical protein
LDWQQSTLFDIPLSASLSRPTQTLASRFADPIFALLNHLEH